MLNLAKRLLRIKTVLRRRTEHTQLATQGEATPGEAAQFAGWKFDLAKRELSSPDGKAIDLTSGEFDLLSVFVRHPQRVLSRVQLLDYARGKRSVLRKPGSPAFSISLQRPSSRSIGASACSSSTRAPKRFSDIRPTRLWDRPWKHREHIQRFARAAEATRLKGIKAVLAGALARGKRKAPRGPVNTSFARK